MEAPRATLRFSTATLMLVLSIRLSGLAESQNVRSRFRSRASCDSGWRTCFNFTIGARRLYISTGLSGAQANCHECTRNYRPVMQLWTASTSTLLPPVDPEDDCSWQQSKAKYSPYYYPDFRRLIEWVVWPVYV